MATSPFHPELQGAARFLPRGVIRPWTRTLLATLSRLPSYARAPKGISTHSLPGTTATVRIISPSSTTTTTTTATTATTATTDKPLRPMILWIHGGGFVIGSAAQDDATCMRIARETGAVVFSVDYRLAPEHPFPAPLDDCAAAWAFMHELAEGLGVDPTQSVIMGQSAGGGLAAGLVLRLIDEGGPLPLKQCLIYPMLDDRTAATPIDNAGHRVWDNISNAIGWGAYLGGPPGGDDVSDYAAPARRSSSTLAGLPQTWIGVGSADLFSAEDIAYARALEDAGVDVELVVADGAFHGFEVAVPKAAVSRSFIDAYLQSIKRSFSATKKDNVASSDARAAPHR